MKKINKFVFTMILINTMLLTGCQKDFEKIDNQIIQNESDIKVIDGTLYFSDVDAFIRITNDLGELSGKDRDEWEESINFKSLRSEINDVFNLIENAKTENDVQQILINNEDIIYDKEGMIVSKIPIVLYQSICNREGVFFVGNTIHKVYENRIYTANGNNISSIDEVIAKGITENRDVKSKEIYLRQNDFNDTERYFGCYRAHNYHTSPNYRRIRVYIVPYRVTIYNNFHRKIYQFVSVERVSKSYKKSWGEYRPRKANHHRKNIVYRVNCPVSQSGPGSENYGYVDEQFLDEIQVDGIRVYSQWKQAGAVITVIDQNHDIEMPYLHADYTAGDFTTTGYNGVQGYWVTPVCN